MLERRAAALIALLFLAGLVSVVPPAAAPGPVLNVEKIVDAWDADPGDVLTYTIFLNNSGPDTVTNIVANDTLPSPLIYENDNASALPNFVVRNVSGNLVQVNVSALPPGNYSYWITASVPLTASPGAVVQNTVSVDYSDSVGTRFSPAASSLPTTLWVPVVAVEKKPAALGRTSGDTSVIGYMIWVNVSVSIAQTVWVNDTFPPGFDDQPPLVGGGCSQTSDALNCTWSNVFVSRALNRDLRLRPAGPLSPGTYWNVAKVEYTDRDGTKMGTLWSNASIIVTSAVIVSVEKVANATTVPPGGSVRFTVYVNNTGSAAASEAWINDTLPNGLTFRSFDGGLPPGCNVQGTLRVNCNSLPVGPTSFSYFADVSPTAPTSLANSLTVDYWDDANAKGPQLTDQVVLTVSGTPVNVPSFTVSVVAPPTVAPGQTATVTVFYNNTGTGTAATVWVNLTLAAYVQSENATPAPASVQGQVLGWVFTDVAPGSYRIDVRVRILDTAPLDTSLQSDAELDATDAFGRVIPGATGSVQITVRTGGGIGWWWLLLVLALAAGGVAAWLLLTRREGKVVIDELFLLHKQGILIKHYTRRLKPDVDSDILSGMLVAVQNFIQESFLGEAGLNREGTLDELRFGDYRIIIRRGTHTIVAAVLAGDARGDIPEQMDRAIKDLEKDLGPVLAEWDGDMKKVTGADAFMQKLMAGQYRKR